MSSVRVHIEHVLGDTADDHSQKSRFVNSTLEGRKNEAKEVTIVRAESTASVEVEIFPSDTVEQFLLRIIFVYPQMVLTNCWVPTVSPITGDLYQAVRAGAQIDTCPNGTGWLAFDTLVFG